MASSSQLFACDGCLLKAGCLLQPFHPAFLGPEAWFLAAAPLWQAEPDGAGGWRARPLAGGAFWPLTQDASWCCRVWSAPAVPVSSVAETWFPASTAMAA